MNMEDRAQTVNERFSERAVNLDSELVARLDTARLRAVAEFRTRQRERDKPPSRAWVWAPAGLAATLVAGVLAGVMWLQSGTEATTPGIAAPDDLEIVLSADNLDMYADLDFYEWLSTQSAGNGVNAG